MPKSPKPPRLPVQLDAETYAAVREFSELTGNSLTGTVSHMLNEFMPYVRTCITAIRLAKESKGEALDAIDRLMLETASKASQMSLEIKDMQADIRATERTRSPKRASGKAGKGSGRKE